MWKPGAKTKLWCSCSCLAQLQLEGLAWNIPSSWRWAPQPVVQWEQSMKYHGCYTRSYLKTCCFNSCFWAVNERIKLARAHRKATVWFEIHTFLDADASDLLQMTLLNFYKQNPQLCFNEEPAVFWDVHDICYGFISLCNFMEKKDVEVWGHIKASRLEGANIERTHNGVVTALPHFFSPPCCFLALRVHLLHLRRS